MNKVFTTLLLSVISSFFHCCNDGPGGRVQQTSRTSNFALPPENSAETRKYQIFWNKMYTHVKEARGPFEFTAAEEALVSKAIGILHTYIRYSYDFDSGYIDKYLPLKDFFEDYLQRYLSCKQSITYSTVLELFKAIPFAAPLRMGEIYGYKTDYDTSGVQFVMPYLIGFLNTLPSAKRMAFLAEVLSSHAFMHGDYSTQMYIFIKNFPRVCSTIVLKFIQKIYQNVNTGYASGENNKNGEIRKTAWSQATDMDTKDGDSEKLLKECLEKAKISDEHADVRVLGEASIARTILVKQDTNEYVAKFCKITQEKFAEEREELKQAACKPTLIDQDNFQMMTDLMENELNFSMERLNVGKIKDAYKQSGLGKIINTVKLHSKDNDTDASVKSSVLILAVAEGITIKEMLENVQKKAYTVEEMKKIRKILINSRAGIFYHMYHSKDCYTTDVHSGNIMIDIATGKITLIDMGRIGDLSAECVDALLRKEITDLGEEIPSPKLYEIIRPVMDYLYGYGENSDIYCNSRWDKFSKVLFPLFYPMCLNRALVDEYKTYHINPMTGQRNRDPIYPTFSNFVKRKYVNFWNNGPGIAMLENFSHSLEKFRVPAELKEALKAMHLIEDMLAQFSVSAARFYGMGTIPPIPSPTMSVIQNAPNLVPPQ